MTKWVVDANVAIKWVLPEIYSDTALSILDNDDDQLLVPDFFFSEITNIFWKRIQRGELSLTEAREGLKFTSHLRLTTTAVWLLRMNGSLMQFDRIRPLILSYGWATFPRAS